MSVIDLKFTTLNIKDGYGPSLGPGKVNNGAGYAAAATTMVVDGFTDAVAVGNTFKLADHPTIYTISAHTETSSKTTSITFAPGLVDAAVDNDDVVIQTHMLEVRIGEGTFSYDEKRKMEYKLDRGRLWSIRQGDEEPVDVRFDIVWEFITGVGSSGVPTIEDALKQRGEADDWVTSSADPCEPYSVDIIILYDPPCDGIDHEQIILKDFRWEGLNHDAKAGHIAVTGKSNKVEAIASRYSVST